MTRHSTLSPAPTIEHRTTSSLARIANVVLDPSLGFRGIGQAPTSGVAFISLVAVRFGSLFAFYHPDTNAAKLAAGVLFQVATLIPLLTATTVVLWAVGLMWRVRLRWASAWCLTVHTVFAYTLATVAIASVAGALLPESADVDLRQPPFTNFSALVVRGDSPVLRAFLTEADVRSVYAAVLAYLGVRAASGARVRDAAGVVATCFIARVVAVVCTALAR